MDFFDRTVAAFNAAGQGDFSTLDAVLGAVASLVVIATALATSFAAVSKVIRWIAQMRRDARLEPGLTGPQREIIGRNAEFRTMASAFARTDTGRRADRVVLTGGPGIGKSALAWAYRKAPGVSYDRTPWIDARTEASIRQALAGLKGVGVPAEGSATMRATEARKGIEADHRARWLIVFDAAEDRAIIERWAPEAGHVDILVTARGGDWTGADYTEIGLGPLPAAYAVKLLEDTAGRSDRYANRLARDLGWLPFGVIQAGEWLRENPDDDFRAYRRRLVELADKRQRKGRAPRDYALSTAAAIELNLNLVRLDPYTGDDEWALLRLLPWLAKEGADVQLIRDACDGQHAGRFSGEFDPVLRAIAATPARLHAAVDRLCARGLATATGDAATRRIEVAPVVALEIVARLAYDAPALRRAAAAVVAAGYPGGAHDVQDPATWPACARLNPHVAALAADPPMGAAMEFLLNQAALYWGQQAETATALAYARAALAQTIARLGADHPEVGIAHATLGGALSRAGHHEESVVAREASLRIAEAQGPDYSHLGKALANLAAALKHLAGKKDAEAAVAFWRRAEGLDRRAWVAARRRIPRRPRGTVGARSDLHLDLAARLNNFADSYQGLGRRGRAICFAAAALFVYRETVPPGDYRIAFALQNLGFLRLQARAPALAAPLLREALTIRESAFPDRAGKPPHPDRVTTARMLAACLFALDPQETTNAEALCARYDLDVGERRAKANEIMHGG